MKHTIFCALLIVALTSTAFAQRWPRPEVAFGAALARGNDSITRKGGTLAFSFKLTDRFDIQQETGIYSQRHFSSLFGAKFNVHRNARTQPWVHFLVGPAARPEGPNGSGPFRFLWAMEPGGGVDFSLNSVFRVRFGADYLRSFREGPGDINQFRLQTGIVIR